MPEPFKNLFNPRMIKLMGGHLARADATFDNSQFIKLATANLSKLELKERSNQICSALETTLPTDYRRACRQMLATLHPVKNFALSNMDTDESGVKGWGVMPMADFVARRGLDDFDYSMNVLKKLTKVSSAEFAIRPFLASDAEQALRHVMKWTTDRNVHVRRLASEGTRPRLPWGIRLSGFVQDPSPILPVLEQLKDDPQEYVRRSVANNLNDIAKDHPEVVAHIARHWRDGASVEREKLVRHACRTLVKQGHKPTLKALGYDAPKVSLNVLQVHTQKVKLGGTLEFTVDITSSSSRKQSLVIDYVIHHRKANGKTSPKVFKLRVIELPAKQQITITKKHAIKLITTRTYYSGQHALEIQINGESHGRANFHLSV